MSYQIQTNKLIFIFSIFFVFNACFSSAESRNEAKKNLYLKSIIIPDNGETYPKYEYGKKLFPEYSFWGLPDSFLIKKKPDVSIKPTEIESIKIVRMPYIPPGASQFQVSIRLNSSAASKVQAYTKENLKRKVAFSVGKDVFYIGTILDPIKDTLIFITLRKPFLEIYGILSQLSDDIETENIQEKEWESTGQPGSDQVN